MVSWTHPEKAVSRLNSDALVTQLPSSSHITNAGDRIKIRWICTACSIKTSWQFILFLLSCLLLFLRNQEHRRQKEFHTIRDRDKEREESDMKNYSEDISRQYHIQVAEILKTM